MSGEGTSPKDRRASYQADYQRERRARERQDKRRRLEERRKRIEEMIRQAEEKRSAHPEGAE